MGRGAGHKREVLRWGEEVSEGKWRVKTVQGGNEAGMEVTVDEKDMALRTKEGICKLIKRTDDPDEVRM